MSNPIALYKRVSELLGRTYVPVVIDPRGGLTAGLDYNGNAPIDASTQINAFLAQASEKLPVILDFDIGVGMLEPLYIPNGYVSIIGRGHTTGIWMMPGANCHCVSNETGWQGNGQYGNQNPGGAAPAQSGKNIVLKNFFINGNRGTGAAVATPTVTTVSGSPNITVSSATGIATGQLIQGTGIPAYSFVGSISGTTVGMVDKTGAAANATASGSGVSASFFASNSTTGSAIGITSPSGGFNRVFWYHGIDLISVADLVIEDVYYYNIPAYSCRVSNFSNFTHRGGYMDGTAVQVLHNDGIHMEGPGSMVVIDGTQFNSLADNNIALNCPEGYGGNITDVTIKGCNFVKAFNGLFTYTTLGGANPQYFTQRVSVDGCNATLNHFSDSPESANFIQLGGGSVGALNAVNAIDQITVSNCNVTGVNNCCFMIFADSCGAVSVKNTKFIPNGAQAAIEFLNTGLTVQDFDLDLTIYNSVNTAVALLQAANTATIKRLRMMLDLFNEPNTNANWAYVVDPTDLTVSDWEIVSLNPAFVTALINGSTWTNLPVIRGAGVLGTGFEIPDANMADGVLYLSGTTFPGDAAIKIGGTAYKVAGP